MQSMPYDRRSNLEGRLVRIVSVMRNHPSMIGNLWASRSQWSESALKTQSDALVMHELAVAIHNLKLLHANISTQPAS